MVLYKSRRCNYFKSDALIARLTRQDRCSWGNDFDSKNQFKISCGSRPEAGSSNPRMITGPSSTYRRPLQFVSRDYSPCPEPRVQGALPDSDKRPSHGTILYKNTFNSKLSGNEVFYTVRSFLVILPKMCRKLHCQKVLIEVF